MAAIIAVPALLGLLGVLVVISDGGLRRPGPSGIAVGQPGGVADLALQRQMLSAEIAALGAEAARLRASVAAERARLAALDQQREALNSTLDVLRREAAAAPPVSPSAPTHGAANGSGAASLIAGAEAAPPRLMPLPSPAVAETEGAAPVARVVVHHRAASPLAERAAAVAAEVVRGETGFELAEVRGVASVPAARVVRYFHAEDVAAAARLAARLGPGWAIQDFRALTPSPPPQTLEVWLPER